MGFMNQQNITRGARIGPGKLIIDGDPQRSAHLMPGENGWNSATRVPENGLRYRWLETAEISQLAIKLSTL